MAAVVVISARVNWDRPATDGCGATRRKAFIATSATHVLPTGAFRMELVWVRNLVFSHLK